MANPPGSILPNGANYGNDDGRETRPLVTIHRITGQPAGWTDGLTSFDQLWASSAVVDLLKQPSIETRGEPKVLFDATDTLVPF